MNLAALLGYAVPAYLIEELANPLGAGLAFFPTAGLALALALIHGRRVAPGLFLGALLFQFFMYLKFQQATADIWVVLGSSLLPAMGAMLQAYGFAWFLKRQTHPKKLTWLNLKDIARFVLFSPVFCLLSASIGSATLVVLQGTPLHVAQEIGLSWWVGDTTGVLLLTPALVAWMLRADVVWTARARLLWPLALGFSLMLGGAQVALQNLLANESTRDLNRTAEFMRLALTQRMNSFESSLRTLQYLFEATPDNSEQAFDEFAAATLGSLPDLWALSYNPLITPAERADFSQYMRKRYGLSEGILSLQSNGQLVPSLEPGEKAFPMKLVAPLSLNLRALGLDLMSEPVRRAALMKALATGRAALTDPIFLVQGALKQWATLMIFPVYQATDASTEQSGKEEVSGVVVATINLQTMLQAVGKHALPAGFGLEMGIPGAGNRTLKSLAGANLLADRSTTLQIPEMGNWVLHVGALQQAFAWRLPQAKGWIFLALMLSAMLIQVMVLLLTGRNQAISEEVQRKTLALQNRELELARTQERAHLGSWKISSDRTVTLSAQAGVITGLESDVRLDHTILLALVHPEDLPELKSKLRHALLSGVLDCVFRLLKGQETVFVRLQGDYTVDPQGRLLHAEGTLQDVSELTAAEMRMQVIMDAANDAIILINPAGLVTYWNQAASRLFGFSASQVLGRRLEESIIPPKQRLAHTQGHGRFVRTGQSRILNQNIELPALHAQGHTLTVELTLSSVQLADGLHVLGMVRDVSQRKKITKDLEQAKAAAEAANEAKSHFLAVMSHELRTPMNAVLGLLPHLAESRLDDEQRMQVNTIMDASKGLMRTLNDILEFSSLQAGAVTLEPEPFNLHVLLDSVEKLHQPLASKKSLDLQFEVSSALRGQYVGDSLRMSQVLNNLVGNAIKFTDKGVITVRALPLADGADPGIRFEVMDCGMGLSEEQISRLFQSFTQAESSTKRRFGGTGLGLSTCKQLVELMGGEIGVQSSLGQGSTFWFTLVLPDCDVAMPDQDLTSLRGLSSAAPTGKSIEQLRVSLTAVAGARVLVVEDNKVNQKVVQIALESLGMVMAHSADNGRLGFEYLAGCSGVGIDVVLMDLHMPVMGGLDATLAIRAAPWGQEIPIIAMTAAAYETDRQATRRAGMNAYLSKPFEIDQLAQLLMAHLPARCAADASASQPAPVDSSTQAGARAQDLPAGALSLEGFDLTLLNSLSKAAPDKLRGVITAYGLDLLDWQTNWQQALVRDDVKSMKTLAHTLAGSAGMIGAHQTHQAASALEKALRDAGQAPNALQQACLVEIKANVRVLMAQGFLHPEELS